jgi:hypothetical protein
MTFPALGPVFGAAARIDLLEAYVETYLTQDIRAEALVKSLESFTRFLEVAALANAQVTSVAALARAAGRRGTRRAVGNAGIS